MITQTRPSSAVNQRFRRKPENYDYESTSFRLPLAHKGTSAYMYACSNSKGAVMAFNLKLPEERGKQLQMIAEAEGKSVVDVITDHIREKVASGVIPADLPFVEVQKTDTGLTMIMPGFEGDVPADEVPALADALRDAGAKLTPADVERKRKLIEGLAALSGIKVKRMAQGVKLVSPFTGKEYPLASGVAADLADQIERAAK